ncbi:MAG: zinc ABC transporter substrate-binding protein ZnuA [Motiliproteus sp.]
MSFRTLFFTALLLATTQPAAATEVVTSVKPLQLLAAAIMQGVGEPTLLLPGNSSPHDYQLRPSDLRKLDNADVIFWVGPELEYFLQKVLGSLTGNRETIALMPLVKAGEDEEHDEKNTAEDKGSAGQQQDHHDHHGNNPHIWLSPTIAQQIATQMAHTLSAKDPDNAAHYARNLTKFKQALATLDKDINSRLLPLRQRGYYVFHDAYSHFEQHYQLKHLGAFVLDPSRRPGARHLQEIRTQLENSQAVCVFSEPQFKPAILESLINGININQGELDPLAASAPLSADGFVFFMKKLSDQFVRCLSPEKNR